MDEETASLWTRAGLATPVRDDDARRLGVDRLVRFEKSQKVRLIKDFVHRDGAMTPAGTIATYDPELAARVCNLGFATALGDDDV